MTTQSKEHYNSSSYPNIEKHHKKRLIDKIIMITLGLIEITLVEHWKPSTNKKY